MTIDIHKAIGKLPIIPKRGFVLPNMNYCGAYNPLDKQLIYDKNGDTYKNHLEIHMLYVLSMMLIILYQKI